MTRVTPASHIVVAAVIAVVAGLLAGLMTSFADTTLLSLVALFTFVGGVLTPWLAQTLTASRSAKASSTASNTSAQRTPPASRPKAAASGHNPDGSEQVTLYVGNLPFKTNEENVEDTFSAYGEVFAVRLVKDRRTGKKKGYGFVEMEAVGAELALAKLNDTEYEGRTLKVRFANTEPKE